MKEGKRIPNYMRAPFRGPSFKPPALQVVVDFAIVILSDDDIGGEKNQEYKNLQKRARQNVIFELGFFIGKIGRKNVCALYSENVEIPSDYSGVTYIPIDKNGAWKLQVAKELAAAGFTIDNGKLF